MRRAKNLAGSLFALTFDEIVAAETDLAYAGHRMVSAPPFVSVWRPMSNAKPLN
jgi:hypothetical protein